MLMYPGHIQNWLDYSHGFLICVILVLFWLSEMGQIWGFRGFPGKPIEEMAWNFAWFRVSGHFGHALWIFLIMVPLWLKLVIFGVSGHYLENVWEYMSRRERRHISDDLRRVLSSYSIIRVGLNHSGPGGVDSWWTTLFYCMGAGRRRKRREKKMLLGSGISLAI